MGDSMISLLIFALVCIFPPTAYGNVIKREGNYNQCMDPRNTAPRTHFNTCPAKLQMDQYGHCGPLTLANGCTAYCQVSVSWDYGREVPFDSVSPCAASDDRCSITSSASTSIEKGFSFNIGGVLGTRDLQSRGDDDSPLSKIKAAFNFGATWSWSETHTNVTAGTSTKPGLDAGKAGYWTFIPYTVTSCGSLTVGSWSYEDDPRQSSCSHAQTTGNFCQTVPYTDAHGNPAGKTVFVATSNSSNPFPLPFCWQDSAFLEPGVAANESVYSNYVTAHEDFDPTKPVLSTAKYMCEHKVGQFDVS